MRKTIGLLLLIALVAGTLASCAGPPPAYSPRDYWEQQYEDNQLQKAIREQSG